jgi:hypothetical protein
MTPNHISITTTELDHLHAEITRLTGALAKARLQSANRLAAIRAALSAADDGECDPLACLRDQLAEETESAGDHRSGPC